MSREKEALSATVQNALKLHQEGKFSEAVLLYQEILKKAPINAEDYYNFGLALQNLQRHEEAALQYKKAIELKSDYVEAYNVLGVVLSGLHYYNEAIMSYEKALVFRPNYAAAYSNWGNTLQETKHYKEAIVCYAKAIQLDPNYAITYNNYGVALQGLKRYEEAIPYYEKAIALKADYGDAYNNFGNALKSVDRYEEAMGCYEKATAFKPLDSDIYNNWAVVLNDLNRYDEALCYYEKALALNPKNYGVLFNKALTYLSLSRFEEGWRLYENRWKRKDTDPPPIIPFPLWQGEKLTRKKVLIVSEQGVGDQLQMLRYLPFLKKMQAQCWVQTTQPLESLIKRSFKSVHVVTSLDAVPNVDYWIFIMSLPLLFKTFSEQDIPRNVPYFVPNLRSVARWKKQFGSMYSLKVGIIWRGNKKHKRDRHRSIPLETLLPLFANNKIQFVVLQKDITDSEHAALQDFVNVELISDELKSFDDTAAAMMAVDLVISVDTAIAHLAGALNKKIWILLQFSPDWRWLLNRSDSLWYPSAKLIRQQKMGCWDEVVAEIGSELKGLISKSKNKPRGQKS